MSTSAVTLDFSKAQPISAPSGGVTLDFSKAQPIDKQPPLADQAHAEMSAKPAGAKQWLTDLESDLRYGGEQTVVGRALKAAGYQGAESLGGMEGTAGKTLVSPLTGPVFAAHGVAEAASGHPLRGAGEILSGIGEASQVPMAFAAPETAEAAAPIAGKVGETGLAVGKAAVKVADVASFNRIGKIIQAMRSGAGDISDIWRGNSGAATTAAKVTRFTAADRQAATELLQDATARVVDNAIPPNSGASALTKARVEHFLSKGDVASAESALDQGAKQSNPAWQPLQRQVVPSTNEIRARVQAEAAAPKVGSYADLKDDNQVLDSVRNDFQRHEWAAASEARREFIARNSSGVTKGELASRFAKTQTGESTALTTAPKNDLPAIQAGAAPPSGPVPFRGSMWEYKGGQFLKDGKILDKSDDIADALAALSQEDYFGGKTIEGEALPARRAATSGKGVPAAAPATPDDLTEVLQKSLDAVRARQQAK